ncbi:MAG: FtsX-like permease family protein [Lachnospiraceae bacterium]|nr:FtsX-like permease family protein [Lachnospiraceae bacterium]
MLLHILQKDLKRKRTMNAILFLFIILASTFLAASVNNMVTIAGALDYYMDVANVPDYMMIALGESGETPVDGFLQNSSYVTEYEALDMYLLTDDTIEIAHCTEDVDRHSYERGATLLLGAVPENFTRIFDAGDAPLSLKSGEIAVPNQQAELNGLAVGDVLRISGPDKTMEFTIAEIVKDAVLGSTMISTKRLFISKADYHELMGDSPRYHTMLYAVNCTDVKGLEKELKQQNVEVIAELEKSTIKMCYFFNLLMAGLLVVVGICLILISFLILRFTIVFTLQEDYKEIGIMKAIGIRDGRIKGIYLLKYFAVTLVGSVVGFLISIPFGKALLMQVIQDFVMPPLENLLFLNLFCVVCVVLLVVLFCYGCTGKIRKFTAVEAIRNGSSAERYHAGGKIRFHRRKRMPASIYLACNDVTGHLKRYAVLIATFCIGTMEILLLLTATHTLQSEGIVRIFCVQPCSVYMDTGAVEKYIAEKDETLLYADIRDIREKLAENGIASEVWIELWYSLPCYGADADMQTSNTAYTMQQTGKDEDDYDILEGSVPILENEVMVTERTAEDLGVSIGDCVHYQFPEGEKEFIVTGIYQSVMNMGYGLRVSSKAQLPFQMVGGGFAFQIQAKGEWKVEEFAARVAEVFPDYRITTAREWVSDMVGVMDEVAALQKFVTVMVLLINTLITVLMVKTLITRERGEIAMLKSIGFADRTIRAWQSFRIMLVLFLAIVLGTVFSEMLDSAAIGSVFSVMGANSIQLVKKPLETYLLYPLLMLAVTGVSAYLCAAEVKRVDVKEINTLE